MEPHFTTHDWILTLALSFGALAIAGATALAIFYPLSLVHLRDKHPQWREQLLSKPNSSKQQNSLLWFMRGGFRPLRDANLDGLAIPLQISLWVIATGVACAWMTWLVATYFIKGY